MEGQKRSESCALNREQTDTARGVTERIFSMRKRDKQKALDFIKTLYLAHDEIWNAINGNNPDMAQILLGQCLEGAEALENMIGSLESRESVTVTYIHGYGDALRRISQAAALSSRPADSDFDCAAEEFQEEFKEKFEALNKELLKVEESTKRDIPVRIEAVFLPYKASMWDSLESVWRAAEEDADCDAYVIPIPYYDKNPDGSFREEYYEGDQYPDYVPVTHYNQYDFVNRHPDMIFIHNPYDEQNYVTSVHPFFYSKNLKQFTDLLVYIPYFILEEPDVYNEQSRERIKGFCITPGVFHADKVVVQSENMRQVYVEILTAFAGKDQVSRKYWEEKVLGLGSPKVDKVLDTKMEDLSIPEEWMKIIRKPDGSWKKIIFYNTGVIALLQNDGKMLRKMKYVFETLKKCREDVALLWRPHPLIESTITSMRPELWEQYKKIRDGYIREGWGIFDDTADLDRAVALSDGYYGDGSSIVQLCRNVHMPILMQDIGRVIYEHRWLATPNAMVVADRKVYFSERFTDGLYCLDPDTFETDYIGSLFTNMEDKRLLHNTIIKQKNKLYFIPFNSEFINIYDIEKYEIKYIILPEELAGKSEKFYCGAASNGNLVLFGYSIEEIWIYNIKTGNFKILPEVAEKISKDLSERPKQGFFIHDAVTVGNMIYSVSIFGDFILQIDIMNYEFELVKLRTGNKGYSGIVEEENNLWLTPYCGSNFVKYNIVTGEYIVLAGDYDTCNWSYTGAIARNGKLYAIPCFGENPLQIDLDSNQVSVINEIKEAVGENVNGINAFLKPISINNHMICSMINRSEIMIFDTISKNVRLIKLVTNERGNIIGNTMIFYESPQFDFWDLIKLIDVTKKIKCEKHKKNGRYIYEAIIEDFS